MIINLFKEALWSVSNLNCSYFFKSLWHFWIVCLLSWFIGQSSKVVQILGVEVHWFELNSLLWQFIGGLFSIFIFFFFDFSGSFLNLDWSCCNLMEKFVSLFLRQWSLFQFNLSNWWVSFDFSFFKFMISMGPYLSVELSNLRILVFFFLF